MGPPELGTPGPTRYLMGASAQITHPWLSESSSPPRSRRPARKQRLRAAIVGIGWNPASRILPEPLDLNAMAARTILNEID